MGPTVSDTRKVPIDTYVAMATLVDVDQPNSSAIKGRSVPNRMKSYTENIHAKKATIAA
jgi:hypothetical protein